MPTTRRVSPLLVTHELGRTASLYHELGFEAVPTDDPGCIGYVTGETGVILVDQEFAERCWGADVVPMLADRFVPYIFLERVDDAVVASGEVLADVRTSFGTHEQVLLTVAGPVILVEVVD